MSLVKADDCNLLDKNMHTVTKRTATLLFSRNEVDLELQGSFYE
jgi:hypothetical protein